MRCTPRSRRLEEPRIALAMVVENAGFGAGAAAPIARRVFDYVLAGQYPSEEDIAADAGAASRRRRSARRGRSTSVPLPGATVDGAAPRGDADCAGPAPPRQPGGTAATGARATARPAGRTMTMSAVFDAAARRGSALRPVFTGFDGPLLPRVLLLGGAGLVTMYSAGFDHGTRFVDHGRNMLLAFGVLFIVAQIPPQRLMRAGGAALHRRRGAAGRDRACSASRRRARRAGSTSAS